MSRTIALAATGIAALAATTAVATAGTPASPATLHLTARPGGGSGLDVGHKGPTIGDEFFEHGALAPAAGHYQLTTQLVAGGARRGTEEETVSLSLAHGTIEAQGGHATTNRFAVPVIGGTGRYAGVRGTLAVAPGRHGAERVTVRLDR